MSKSATINTTTAKKIVSELEEFEKLKTHLLRLLPDGIIPYGSKLWWEKEVLQGEEEIKKREIYNTIILHSVGTHDEGLGKK